MKQNAKNLLLAEMERVKELIEVIEATVVPEYECGKDNDEYFKNAPIMNQATTELKQRLTMLRKDAIILRKQLEDER